MVFLRDVQWLPALGGISTRLRGRYYYCCLLTCLLSPSFFLGKMIYAIVAVTTCRKPASNKWKMNGGKNVTLDRLSEREGILESVLFPCYSLMYFVVYST